jgi:hypothetical protein
MWEMWSNLKSGESSQGNGGGLDESRLLWLKIQVLVICNNILSVGSDTGRNISPDSVALLETSYSITNGVDNTSDIVSSSLLSRQHRE